MVKPPDCPVCGGRLHPMNDHYLVKFKLENNQKVLTNYEVGHQQNWVWFCKHHAPIAKIFNDMMYSEVKDDIVFMSYFLGNDLPI